MGIKLHLDQCISFTYLCTYFTNSYKCFSKDCLDENQTNFLSFLRPQMKHFFQYPLE
jgi:hypothetical protein